MLILRDPADLRLVEDLSLRALLTQRFSDLSQGAIEDFDSEVMGYFVLIEAGDSLSDIEAQTEA